jgi:DNA segregation ATPase FtsK/SpoIIIE-like protein
MIIPGQNVEGEMDELFKEAAQIVVQYDRVSSSLLQRRLSIGYARASRLIDQLEAAGIIGPADGSKPRDVLKETYEDYLSTKGETSSKEVENPFEVPANYKVPKDLMLSRGDKSPWGKKFSDVFKKDAFKDFSFPLGFDYDGKLHAESFLDAGNMIVAGNTLSQKENLIDTILLTYLLQYRPEDLRLILVDPTHYLDLYSGIPHLLSPVISDYGKLVSAFRWSLDESDRRLKLFAEAGVRNFTSYNETTNKSKLPRILFVTFFNLFDVETESAFTLLTSQGTRAGIHNILVVERTTGKNLPGGIKSNIPARVVFSLSSSRESRAIDVSGAEKLEPGEIIYKPNFGGTTKLKAIYTPEENVKEVVEAVKQSSQNA